MILFQCVNVIIFLEISLLVYNDFGTTSLYRATGLTVFINV